MALGKIPFGNQQASGLEPLAGASPIAFNVLTEPNGTIRRRPGVRTTSDLVPPNYFETGISAIYVTLDGSLYVVDNSDVARRIFYVTPTGAISLTTGNPSALMGLGKPQIAETEMLLVLAGGREMQKVELATRVSSRLGGSPPSATHVIGNASRLLANDDVVDRTKVRYSDLALGTTTFAGHEVWSFGVGTAGFFTAEANPDPVVAIAESTNEILVFGSRTTQVYSSDPVLVFAPVSTLAIGCGAPYSVIRSEQDFYMLDHQRRIVVLNGREYQDISAPIRATLESMNTVSDCFGYRALVGPFDCMVWVFPIDGRSLVYQKGAGWSQWAGYSGNWVQNRIVSVAAHPSGKVLAGLSLGNLGELDLSWPYDDLGVPIRAYVESGYINRETDSRKLCKCVRFTLRRGAISGTSDAGDAAYFGWRDQPGDWDARLPIELGATGETDVVVEFYSLGVYRRRQWFFEYSGTDELALVSVTEEFQALEN